MIVKQYIKMLVQNFILPIVYTICRVRKVNKNLVVFADAHHDDLPESMKILYEELLKTNLEVITYICNYSKMSFVGIAINMIKFMSIYAGAGCVVICDNYLPVAACNKRKETKVIQLWHACGAFKKFGYDSSGDIPDFYKGNVFKNYDVVTVSAEYCIDIYSRCMKLPKSTFKAIGVSRTDKYFDKEYVLECRRKFYEKCPNAKGKKVVLWAPTFRGNASNPYIIGEDAIDKLDEMFSDEIFLVKKMHPHLENKGYNSSIEMSTDDLLAVADILITDYSSVIFEYSIFKRPIIFFVPDFEKYSKERGMYFTEKDYPGPIISDQVKLYEIVAGTISKTTSIETEMFYKKHMEMCDGNATNRVVRIIKG